MRTPAKSRSWSAHWVCRAALSVAALTSPRRGIPIQSTLIRNGPLVSSRKAFYDTAATIAYTLLFARILRCPGGTLIDDAGRSKWPYHRQRLIGSR
jgi:hypothetical protein